MPAASEKRATLGDRQGPTHESEAETGGPDRMPEKRARPKAPHRIPNSGKQKGETERREASKTQSESTIVTPPESVNRLQPPESACWGARPQHKATLKAFSEFHTLDARHCSVSPSSEKLV